MGSTQKTETSEEFKALEHETNVRREFTEQVHDSLTVYAKALGKQKSSGADKAKKMPLEIMAEAMVTFGSMLAEDSLYGKALVTFGEAHQRIAMHQIEYIASLRESYIGNLERIISDMKDYSTLKAKLERRRLDFDAKLNKVHKSRKEKPELEEETRVAQMKYEESLTDATQKMIELNSNEDEQLENLLRFMDAEVEYHRRALESISSLQRNLADMPRNDTMSYRRPSLQRASTTNSDRQPPSRSVSTDSIGGGQAPLPGGPLDRKLSYASNAGSMVFPVAGPNGSMLPAPEPTRSYSGHVAQPPANPTAGRKQVQVQFDFDAEGPGELTIRKGDIINVTCEIDEGWWEGEIDGDSSRAGIFPTNYVGPLARPVSAPAPPVLPYRPDSITGQQTVGTPEPQDAFADHRTSVASSRPASEYHLPSSAISQQRPQDRPYSHISRLSYVPNNAPIPPSSSQPQRPANAPKPPPSRNPTSGGGSPAMPPASPASRSRQNSSDHLPLATPASIPASASSEMLAVCRTCGCAEFTANAFRKDQCSNCYHRH
ncbi:uncharacterized protein EV422DRAFT_570139 [Fimicolochytrium jonesii]|uniref:uncharacterized protein n=1 Tax=Fimicolochytrium jonesii TaxID=1396493 RepID=UPI0022FEA4CD|nr:uncharacterized protein EV422DRAFT_570139 [Fimicolochytrium jonesii]KAI8817990.1 hypothetical protein EV422DRAFT_570139 [Fimicolochytrium jonesii]